MSYQTNDSEDREDEMSFTLNGKTYEVLFAGLAAEHPEGARHIANNVAASGSGVCHFGVFFRFESYFIEIQEAEEPRTVHRFQVHYNAMPGRQRPDDDFLPDLLNRAKSAVGHYLRGRSDGWHDSQYMTGWKYRIIGL